jgi:hypothetical protein
MLDIPSAHACASKCGRFLEADAVQIGKKHMTEGTRKLALTDDQIDRLSSSIADSVCANVGGLAHYHSQVVGWVEYQLSGTPYEGQSEPPQEPVASGLAEIKPAADARVVAYLRKLLERAEAGELLAIAVAGELTGREVITGVAGEHDLFRILGALDMIHTRILAGCQVS